MSIYKNDTLSKVKEAIDSLLQQTYKDFYLYVIYDGPIEEDISKYIVNLHDNRIFIYSNKSNNGLAYSMNKLLNIVLAKDDCDYIARMDADDISINNRFEKQILYLNSYLDIDCLGTWAIEINTNGEEFYRKKMPTTHAGCLKLFKKRDCMIHPTVMFRNSYFMKAGLYPLDTYFGEDTMMWAKGFKNGCRFANLPEYLFCFRLDERFFERRRGWNHAKSIFVLRHRVNKMLNFGYIGDCYALLYAVAKMMPKNVLNIIYKSVR